MLGVPLQVDGRVIGVLHIGSLTPREFSAADTELLQLVAERISLAIEHARIYEAERHARTQLERLQAVTDVALAHLALEELLGELLLRIKTILEVDTSAILMLDEATQELVARAAVGIEEEVEQGVRIPVGAGFAGKVAAERRPVYLPDVDHAHVLNPILRQKGIKSMLGVPLQVDGRVIGVLHIGSLTPREFSAADTELLQLVAERISLAIAKAQLHDETVRLDQMKLNFVAIASHELRTPATSIYGMLATLCSRRDTLSNETRVQLEEVAWQEAERLRRLIEQLLDLSRLDARAMRVRPQPIVVERVLEEIVQADGRRPGEIHLEVAPDLAAVVDPLVLDRVIGNLIANALRHGATPIEVVAEQRDRHLRISVKDHGPGVPSKLVPRLFERFERGEHGGSGLGLAIAKTYANAHGGELVYHSEDDGARFELILPPA
jgi:signal transduction histidine kinase